MEIKKHIAKVFAAAVALVLRTAEYRIRTSPDVSLYSEDLQNNLIHDVISFIDKRDRFDDACRRYLLTGPPGTGKSSVIKKVIRLLPRHFTPIIVSHVECLNQFLIKQNLFIVIEDIDLLLANPEQRHILLQFLDGLNGCESSIVIMTTNYPESLPASLLDRPGRVDKIVELLPADFELRKKQVKEIFPNIDSDELAKMTDGFTFAHYRELSRRLQIFSNFPWQDAVAEMHRDIARRKAFLKGKHVD